MSAGGVAASADRQEPVSQARTGMPFSDGLLLAVIAQLERVVGLTVAFSSRWYLNSADLGIYSGLRLLLDNTNRSSLGVALGAIQRSVLHRARGQEEQASYVLSAAATANTLTSTIYGLALAVWGLWLFWGESRQKWGLGLVLIGLLAVIKRRQDFQIAVLRSCSEFAKVGRIGFLQNFGFGVSASIAIIAFGFWGLLGALVFSFMIQGCLLERESGIDRFPVVWDLRTTVSLALAGLPILASNSTWALLSTLDKAMILTRMTDGATLAGYYSLALLATSWCDDIASRIATVVSPGYRTAFGQGASQEILLVRAENIGLLLTGLLVPIGFWALAIGNWALPVIFPNLAPGVAALGPLLPGSIALCSVWPMREAWIAADRPWPPAILAAIFALVQFCQLSTVCESGSIASVAESTSLVRIGAAVALFALSGTVTRWTPERLFRWFAIGIWTGFWIGLHHILLAIQPSGRATFLPNLQGLSLAIVVTIAAFFIARAAYGRLFLELQLEGESKP